MLFFFKQKTAYEMRISDWSSDVCASYLVEFRKERHDPAIRLQELVVGSGNQCGVERDACIRIVEDDHAFDSGFIVAGSVDGMCERHWTDRTRVVEGRRVSVRVDIGGGRINTRKKVNLQNKTYTTK